MRQRTAILLIGVIFTVGLSLVVGVGVVDVSAADTLVVDQNGTAEYSSIQTAIDDASAGDTVEIRPGTYAETIVVDKNLTVTAPDGATLDGIDVENPDVGVTIGNDEFYEAENVEPAIRGLTITRYETGIESTTDGNWVVSDVTIRIVQQDGISAFSDGDWTVRETEVIETGGTGIEAGNADGEWVVENTVIRRADGIAIDAGSTEGDWTIRNVSVQDSVGISASSSDGNWVIEQSTVQNGVFASDSNGKWEIRQSIVTGDVPIRAEDTLGEWRVSQSIINEDERTAIDAEDAIAEAIATDNWWGSPSGPDENACVGNVDCSDPLTTRPSDVGYNPDDGDESTPTPTPTPTPDSPEGGITNSQVTLSNSEPTAGSDVTVIVTATPQSESAGFSFSHSFNQSVGSASDITTQVAGSSVDPIIEEVNADGAIVTLGSVTAGEEITIEYTITTEDTAAKAVSITGSVGQLASSQELSEISYTTSDAPTTPGEVTPLTSDNPSPNENRGAIAGVTPYTTADDVLGGIGNGAVIFQGEEDIVFERTDGTEVNPATLERTAGYNEGLTLSVPMPDNQPEGNYANGAGFSVTVQEPRVTELEIQNNTERDVSGGILEPDQNNASVLVEYNYEEAENIELTVENKDGIDVTGEVLDTGEVDNKNADNATPTGSAPDGSVRFELNPSNLNEREYTFSVAGIEDFDSGDATQSVTTTISADQTPSLSLSEDEVAQGSDTTFTIENSPEGEFHPVVIDESEFRDGVSLDQAEDVFRNVGDTVETGVVDSTGPGANDIADVEYAYAIVEINGENGLGSVETQFLENNSATVELYSSDGVTPIESHPATVVLTIDDAFETDDEEDLAVVEDDDSESPVDKYDANNDGEISIIELGQAGQAFASGELTITELGGVGAAFAS